MPNLIERDEVMNVLKEGTKELSIIGMSYQAIGSTHFERKMNEIEETILSLPLQQQGGNEKIKEMIEKKQESIEFMYQGKEPLVKKGNPIHYGALLCCQQLLSEIDNLPPNN